MGDITEEEYSILREDIRSKLNALKPVQKPDLDRAASLLENVGALLEQAELKELKEVFNALLDSVYLDSGEAGPVVAIEPKPFVKQLMDISDPDRSPGGRRATRSDDRRGSAGHDEIPENHVVHAAKYDTAPPPDAGEGKKMVGAGTTPRRSRRAYVLQEISLI
jgi:hypothetical protein